MEIKSAKEIPSAVCYVLYNDRFLSGWGCFGGATSTVILPCSSPDEARKVCQNIHERTKDAVRVRIVFQGKPRLRSGVKYSVHTRETAERFYAEEW